MAMYEGYTYNKYLYVPKIEYGEEIDSEIWKNFLTSTNIPDWYTMAELEDILEENNMSLTPTGDVAFRDKNEYLMFVLKYS